MGDISKGWSAGRRPWDVPRMRSCTVGKLSELGLFLEALVNSISLERYMILTVHNRELVLL